MKNEDHRLDSYYIKYHTMVIRNASVYLEEKSLAEDVAHETFIRLGIHLEKIYPEKVKAWLLLVSARIALDCNRKTKKCKTGLDLSLIGYGTGENDWQDEFFDLSLLMESQEDVEVRKFLITRLRRERPNWHRARVMSEYERMDNKTIGRLLGVSSNLVSKWKSRGRAWLQREYRKEYGDQ